MEKSAKAEQEAAQTARETRLSVEPAVQTTVNAINMINRKAKDTTTAIAAGGTLSAAIVIFICVIGLILGAPAS